MFETKGILTAGAIIVACELGIWRRRFRTRRENPDERITVGDILWSGITVVAALGVAAVMDMHKVELKQIILITVATVFFIENSMTANQFVKDVSKAMQKAREGC